MEPTDGPRSLRAGAVTTAPEVVGPQPPHRRAGPAASGAQQPLTPPITGRSPPPASRYTLTRSACGPMQMYPSAIRAASLADSSPKPDTNTGGVASGLVYSRAVSTW
jgi:hypothetical protein